jgi:transcriptional regulator with XRE-family HTH domain
VQSWLIASYNGFVHDCDVTAQPVDYGEIIASNVRAARARRNITQSSVARRMKALGYRWHFQTVGAVERGERHLLAEELLALSLTLGTPLDDLLLPPVDGQYARLPAGRLIGLPASRRMPNPADWESAWDGDESILSTEPIQEREET